MKACRKCGATKPLSEFYRAVHNRDKRESLCKICKRADSSAYQVVKYRTDPAWVARRRARNRAAMTRVGYRSSPKVQRAAQRRWKLQNREKHRAGEHARRAEHKGQLVNPGICQQCGARGLILKHHPDYSKPLAVEWLCYKCHGLTWRK